MTLPINPAETAPVVTDAGAAATARQATVGSEPRVKARQPEPTVGPRDIDRSTHEVQIDGNTVEVSFNDDVNRFVVKVKTQSDGELVRQFPPEDYLQFLTKFNELIGVVLDEKA